jgi:alpha-N-arabinofuranosidase
LYVLVLNEDPANAYSTTLQINNYAPNSTAAVWKLGENNVLNQTNTAGQPLGVAIQTSSLAVTGSSFSYTFPAHTLTAIHLTGTVSVSSPQPAAYYKLDETSGTAAADSSGSGHTAGWVATSGGSLSWDPSGKINGALRIAPASGGSYGSYYLSIPNTFDPAATDFTVAAWVKLSQAAGAGANQSIFSQEGTGGRNLLYRDVDSGKLKSYLGGIATASVGTIPLGTWTHVALVNHAGTITLYVNGSADTTASVSPEASAGSFRLGANKNPTAINANWNGDLDDVRIYTSALSATQISKIYTGLAP